MPSSELSAGRHGGLLFLAVGRHMLYDAWQAAFDFRDCVFVSCRAWIDVGCFGYRRLQVGKGGLFSEIGTRDSDL